MGCRCAFLLLGHSGAPSCTRRAGRGAEPAASGVAPRPRADRGPCCSTGGGWTRPAGCGSATPSRAPRRPARPRIGHVRPLPCAGSTRSAGSQPVAPCPSAHRSGPVVSPAARLGPRRDPQDRAGCRRSGNPDQAAPTGSVAHWALHSRHRWVHTDRGLASTVDTAWGHIRRARVLVQRWGAPSRPAPMANPVAVPAGG